MSTAPQSYCPRCGTRHAWTCPSLPIPLLLALLLAGCAQPKPVIQTVTVEKPVPVHCKVEQPKECRADYAVDRLNPGADDVTINRALRAEIEERAACEVKLRAAVQGCNQ